MKENRPVITEKFIEEIICKISSHFHRDRCGDYEFDSEEAEDDLREGLREAGYNIEEKK